MRTTTVLRVLLGLQSTRVCSFAFVDDGLVCEVAPTTRMPRCGECASKCPLDRVYDKRLRIWRHLDLAGMRTTLQYEIRRVQCMRCGIRTESVPWAEHGARSTLRFDDHTAYLAQQCAKTTVSALARVTWRTVGRIVRRVVERHERSTADRLDGLRFIGVDELSYRRHHKYITVVVDHERGEIVWASEGKSAATLKRFFEALGPERCGKLEAVTIDLSQAYIKAVTDASPQARLVFDRFHVQRLAHDALDEVRRDEVRKASTEEKSGLKNLRWHLHSHPWNLSSFGEERLAELPRVNKPIYRAYMLKEALVSVLDCRQINVAGTKLDEWLSWAVRSQLAPFKRLAKTIQKHRDGILAYVQTGLNNGRVEGLNGKIRVITRRSFGFHSASSLIAMLFLCCAGIRMGPSHSVPVLTH